MPLIERKETRGIERFYPGFLVVWMGNRNSDTYIPEKASYNPHFECKFVEFFIQLYSLFQLHLDWCRKHGLCFTMGDATCQ